MRRRRFCQYGAIGLFSFTGVTGRNAALAASSPSSQDKSHYQWVVLYWMPYDNDLVRFGEQIVEMLACGTKKPEIAVVVQSDYRGDPQMRRRQSARGIVIETDVAGEDSSDPSAFADYLNWADRTFRAEHWAVIILGHGGKINEISPDDRGMTPQSRTWMRVDRLAEVVSHFNQSTNGRVELLFFQNCTKATLEVVYEAKNCSRYTLASQLALGAPNFYYEGFLNRLASLVDGREAALAIMDSERSDMFHSLTLADNQAVKRIPEKLSPLLQAIANNRLPEKSRAKRPTDCYWNGECCDTLVLLSHLSIVSDRAQNEFAEFSNFLRSSVITSYKTGGELYGSNFNSSPESKALCGLSLYLPETEEDISRYSFFALHREVDLVAFYRKYLSFASISDG